MREQDGGPTGSNDPEEQAAARFRDAMLPYYHAYMEHLASPQAPKDPSHPDHPDRMKIVGNRIRAIRRYAGIKREDFATQLGIEGDDPIVGSTMVAAFETGLIPSTRLPQDWNVRVREVLGSAFAAKEREARVSFERELDSLMPITRTEEAINADLDGKEPYRFVGGKVLRDSEVMKPITDLTDEQVDEVKELDRFGEELLPYFHRYMVTVALVKDPTSPSHPDRLRQDGLRYRSIRKKAGLTRAELAKRMNEDPVRLAAFEGGLVSPNDLYPDFEQSLKRLLTEELAKLPPEAQA